MCDMSSLDLSWTDSVTSCQVSYRIDHSITVGDLLKDACNYWGHLGWVAASTGRTSWGLECSDAFQQRLAVPRKRQQVRPLKQWPGILEVNIWVCPCPWWYLLSNIAIIRKQPVLGGTNTYVKMKNERRNSTDGRWNLLDVSFQQAAWRWSRHWPDLCPWCTMNCWLI